DADTEARWYRAHLPDDLDLPTALDMEQPDAHQPNWLPTRGANTDWALRFFDTIDARTRVLYTNGDGAKNHLDSQRLVAEGVELWYAHPGPQTLTGIASWATAAAVQYGQGDVDGISSGVVDLDVMSEEVLGRWTGGLSLRAQQEDEKVLHIIKGDMAPEWW